MARASRGLEGVNRTIAERTLAVEQVSQTLTRFNRASRDLSSQSQAVDDSTHRLSRVAEKLNRLEGCFGG